LQVEKDMLQLQQHLAAVAVLVQLVKRLLRQINLVLVVLALPRTYLALL
jgi:hypothetical protein